MFQFQAFITYALVVSFTPGPNNLMCMMNGHKVGYRKTLPFIFGVMVGFFTLLMISCFFSLYLTEQVPKFQPAMRIVGAGYLTFLTFKVLGLNPFARLKPKSSKADENRSTLTLNFKSGILLQFFNVKAMLYALTITSSLMTPYFHTALPLIGLCLILITVTLASASSWTLFGTIFNRFLSRYEKPFNIFMALLLFYCALTILGILH